MNAKRIEPKEGQESVWDYPRPPRLEKTDKHIQVIFNDVVIVDSKRAYRLLETSHPPTYYIPREDILMDYLTPTDRATYCEFKGKASYWTIEVNGKKVENAAWMYQHPDYGYEEIRNYICFYPSKMDACYINGEKVQAQAGDFYGGWITSDIVGPFKGEAGTRNW